MLCKCHWIVLYTVHFTAFCLGGPFFPGHGIYHFTDDHPIQYIDWHKTPNLRNLSDTYKIKHNYIIKRIQESIQQLNY